MDRITFEYWLITLKESIVGIVIVLSVFVALIWFIFVSAEKTVNTEILKGSLVGFHYKQLEDASRPVFAVKLESGKIVNVSPVKATPYLKDKSVLIRAKTKESGRIYYQFENYVQ